MPHVLRLATVADVPALAVLYRNTARAMGPWCYSAEQVAAWARFAQQSEAFHHYVMAAETWVACDALNEPLGFSGASADGEVHSLYVRHDLIRRGLGTTLLAQVLDRGRQRGLHHFEAWATPFSRPVFERAGFRLLQAVQGEFEGVMFERYRVGLSNRAG